MAWINPKTNWIPADGISNTDLNRIEGNTLDLDSRVQTWINFKAKGGEIGGYITLLVDSGIRVKDTAEIIRAGVGGNLILSAHEENKNIYFRPFGSFNQKNEAVLSPSGLFSASELRSWGGTIVDGTLWNGAYDRSLYGYTRLSNGLLLQWGTHSTAFVNGYANFPIGFPIAFKERCNSITMNVKHIGAGDITRVEGLSANTIGKDSFNCSARYIDAVHYAFSVNWIAIGF